VERQGALDDGLERSAQRIGQERGPVSVALPRVNGQDASHEVHVLDTQLQGLQQAQAGAIRGASQRGAAPLHELEQRLDLAAGEDDRAVRALGAHEA